MMNCFCQSAKIKLNICFGFRPFGDQIPIFIGRALNKTHINCDSIKEFSELFLAIIETQSGRF